MRVPPGRRARRPVTRRAVRSGPTVNRPARPALLAHLTGGGGGTTRRARPVGPVRRREKRGGGGRGMHLGGVVQPASPSTAGQQRRARPAAPLGGGGGEAGARVAAAAPCPRALVPSCALVCPRAVAVRRAPCSRLAPPCCCAVRACVRAAPWPPPPVAVSHRIHRPAVTSTAHGRPLSPSSPTRLSVDEGGQGRRRCIAPPPPPFPRGRLLAASYSRPRAESSQPAGRRGGRGREGAVARRRGRSGTRATLRPLSLRRAACVRASWLEGCMSGLGPWAVQCVRQQRGTFGPPSRPPSLSPLPPPRASGDAAGPLVVQAGRAVGRQQLPRQTDPTGQLPARRGPPWPWPWPWPAGRMPRAASTWRQSSWQAPSQAGFRGVDAPRAPAARRPPPAAALAVNKQHPWASCRPCRPCRLCLPLAGCRRLPSPPSPPSPPVHHYHRRLHPPAATNPGIHTHVRARRGVAVVRGPAPWLGRPAVKCHSVGRRLSDSVAPPPF